MYDSTIGNRDTGLIAIFVQNWKINAFNSPYTAYRKRHPRKKFSLKVAYNTDHGGRRTDLRRAYSFYLIHSQREAIFLRRVQKATALNESKNLALFPESIVGEGP